MNIDPKLFAQAAELSNKIIDMLKNQKAEVGLLALLAATAMLRRKTTLTVDVVIERFRAAEGIVEIGNMLRTMAGKSQP